MEPRLHTGALRLAMRPWRALRWGLKSVVGARRHIVVEIRWRLGDEVMAIPIYEALRTRYPDSRITVLCNHPDVLIDNPFVDAVNLEQAVQPPPLLHPPGESHLRPLRPLGPLGPLRPPIRPVLTDPSAASRVNDPRTQADRYLLLRSGPRTCYRLEHYARCARVAVPATRPQLYYANWHTPLLDTIPAPFVAVSSGASWPTKRWQIARWRTVCRAIEAMGFCVVELGREDEAIGVGVSLMNTTSVRDAACVLHAATLSVCCDSGLMHLALAAGTPTIALFGPTDPRILVRDEPNLVAIRNDEPCQGCWNRLPEDIEPGTCPLNRAACLDTIPVDRVLSEVRDRLGAKG